MKEMTKPNVSSPTAGETVNPYLERVALASQEREITLSIKLGRELYRYLRAKPDSAVEDKTGLLSGSVLYDFQKKGGKVRVSGQPFADAPPWSVMEEKLDQLNAQS